MRRNPPKVTNRRIFPLNDLPPRRTTTTVDQQTKPGPEAPHVPGADDMAELARSLRAQMATITGGLAPDVYVNAWWDWYLNLSKEPTTQLQIVQDAIEKALDQWTFAVRAATGQELAPVDGNDRFSGDAWKQFPFNVYARGFSNYLGWWQKAWAGVPGVAPSSERTLDFIARNASEAISPANYLASNPELLELTRAEAGANLVRGFNNWIEDVERAVGGKAAGEPGKFAVGVDIATTPGKVVMRNDLVELIQYSPATDTVFAEPILIVPAWIMKYYILDLSAKNSLVALPGCEGPHGVHRVVEEPHRGRSQPRNGRLPEARRSRQLGRRRAHRSRPQDPRRRLLHRRYPSLDRRGGARRRRRSAHRQRHAARGAGGLQRARRTLGVHQSEPARHARGRHAPRRGSQERTDGRRLRACCAPATCCGRRPINTYVRGKRESQNDLMAWNADGTRMPCRMHSEYLRQLYLDNALAIGEFRAEGRQVESRGDPACQCSSSGRKRITSRHGGRFTRPAA